MRRESTRLLLLPVNDRVTNASIRLPTALTTCPMDCMLPRFAGRSAGWTEFIVNDFEIMPRPLWVADMRVDLIGSSAM
jgi:hypothetical protein